MTDDEIIKLYKEYFEKDITNEEVKYIQEHECKCDFCNRGISEMTDFPELVIEDGRLLCEDCFDDEYRELCCICEESHDKRDVKKDFPKDPFFYIGDGNKCGIYHANKYPIYSSNGFNCDIYWENREYLCSIDDFIKGENSAFLKDKLQEYKDFQQESCEFICPECYQKALQIYNKTLKTK